MNVAVSTTRNPPGSPPPGGQGGQGGPGQPNKEGTFSQEFRHQPVSARVPERLAEGILSTGVLVFVFYVFHTPPMLFNRAYDARIAASPHAAEYAALENLAVRKRPGPRMQDNTTVRA